MSGTKVIIEYCYRKLYCPSCGITVESHNFIEPYSRVTKRLAQYIYGLCSVMSIADVSDHVGLSWDQVRHIDKQRLKEEFKNPIPE